jgi:hypothetical protein
VKHTGDISRDGDRARIRHTANVVPGRQSKSLQIPCCGALVNQNSNISAGSAFRPNALSTQFMMNPWNSSKTLALFSDVEENHPYAQLNLVLPST